MNESNSKKENDLNVVTVTSRERKGTIQETDLK